MKGYLTILQRMAFMAVMMMCVAFGKAADSGYYAVYNTSSKTLTFIASSIYQAQTGDVIYRIFDDYRPNTGGLWEMEQERRIEVEKVVFHPSFKTAQFEAINRWFLGFINLKDIEGLENFDMSQVVHAEDLFHNCFSLTSLDLSSKDMSSLVYAEEMFEGCSKLKSLKMPKTSNKLKNIQYLFCFCEALQSLDTSLMDTSGVEDMSGCFFRCSSMTILNLSSFDTSSVTTMAGMFEVCENLKKLYIYNFNTSNVTTMTRMFNNCSKLTDIVVGDGWTVENVQDWGDRDRMFWDCVSIKREQERHTMGQIRNMRISMVAPPTPAT